MAKINLNTASREELARIEGVGNECADRIIQYRNQHGRIQNVDELTKELSSFGEQAMRQLKEQATT
ncbi:MAG: ComEA family DNA-binding protein [Alphaproteobacteria bacterium]